MAILEVIPLNESKKIAYLGIAQRNPIKAFYSNKRQFRIINELLGIYKKIRLE